MMRDMFIEIAFSASAAGNWGRSMSSGMRAEKAGQRIARPMPLAKVNMSSSGAVIAPASVTTHSSVPTAATQNWVKMR